MKQPKAFPALLLLLPLCVALCAPLAAADRGVDGGSGGGIAETPESVGSFTTRGGEGALADGAQPTAPGIPSGLLPVREDQIAVDVGFYTDGSFPGSALSPDLIRRQLEAVSQFSDTVRFYGSAGELAKAYEIAREMGLTVLGNAWLSGDRAANQAELDALIAHCNEGLCKVAIVGSEVLLRGDLSVEELIEAIAYVRERITDKTIPVTTAESVDILLGLPELRDACNLLMPNCYPYWGGSAAEQGAEHFIASMEALEAVCGGKEILVSETGWPTAGEERGEARAGEAEAAAYYAAVRAWSLASQRQVLFFDAADEPWKETAEGPSGSHWGFLTSDFLLKDCYRTLNPFQAPYAIASAGGSGTAAEASFTNRTEKTRAIVCVLAAYSGDGRLMAWDMAQASFGPSESVSLRVSWEGNGRAEQIKAFVLDGSTLAPLQRPWVRPPE